MSVKTKDILIRALKTFWQASVSYLIVNINVLTNAITNDLEVGGFETLKSVGITVLVGALAAGLSAVWNGFIKVKLDSLKVPEIDLTEEDFIDEDESDISVEEEEPIDEDQPDQEDEE